jgi:hypothetical protein
VDWQLETGFDSWNYYRGDLEVLKSDLLYTQAPGSNDLADRICGLTVNFWTETQPLDAGQVAFVLVTGENGQGESGLGSDSAQNERPNDNPCP